MPQNENRQDLNANDWDIFAYDKSVIYSTWENLLYYYKPKIEKYSTGKCAKACTDNCKKYKKKCKWQ